MVRPQPPPRQGLGKPRNDAARFRPSRCHPDRHQTTRALVAFEFRLLALLWQFGFDGVGEEFLAVGASPGWRPCEEVEDGLPDGRHARLWRRSPDFFFSVPLL